MIHRKPDGTFSFDTVAEAIEFDRAMRGVNVATAVPAAGGHKIVYASADQWKNTLDKLRPFHGKNLDAEKLSEILGVSAVTGLGTKLRHLHDRMARQNIDIDNYIIRQQAKDQTVTWHIDVDGTAGLL